MSLRARSCSPRVRGSFGIPSGFKHFRTTRTPGKKATRPCPCGYHGDTEHDCRCSPDQLRHYRGRLSGPFLDRIDIRLVVPREVLRFGVADDGDSSEAVARRVAAARERQLARAGQINARLAAAEVQRWCLPDVRGCRLLERAASQLRLSRRACDSVLRVARSIADLADERCLGERQVAEALALRTAALPN